jgi:gentisate 1,2-dioxygenase
MTPTMTVTIHPRSIGSTHDTSGKAAEYYDSLRQYNAEPLWTVLDRVLPASPNPSAVPTIWRYKDLRPPLMEAGLVVTAEEAERRVLMLINPGLEAPCTTDSIYAGLQLILPGEIAPAHRHVAFALRFIIEGSSGFTAVEGGQMMMERGDVILTPSWQWHDRKDNYPFLASVRMRLITIRWKLRD